MNKYHVPHPGVGLFIKDQFKGIVLRLTGTVQTHVASDLIHRVSEARR